MHESFIEFILRKFHLFKISSYVIAVVLSILYLLYITIKMSKLDKEFLYAQMMQDECGEKACEKDTYRWLVNKVALRETSQVIQKSMHVLVGLTIAGATAIYLLCLVVSMTPNYETVMGKVGASTQDIVIFSIFAVLSLLIVFVIPLSLPLPEKDKEYVSHINKLTKALGPYLGQESSSAKYSTRVERIEERAVQRILQENNFDSYEDALVLYKKLRKSSAENVIQLLDLHSTTKTYADLQKVGIVPDTVAYLGSFRNGVRSDWPERLKKWKNYLLISWAIIIFGVFHGVYTAASASNALWMVLLGAFLFFALIFILGLSHNSAA